MTRRSRTTYNAFGASVSSALADHHLTQSQLADQLKVTPSYLNQLMVHKRASPRWADLVADVLKMSEDQRKTLHVAAARDAGYKIDLTLSDQNKK